MLKTKGMETLALNLLGGFDLENIQQLANPNHHQLNYLGVDLLNSCRVAVLNNPNLNSEAEFNAAPAINFICKGSNIQAAFSLFKESVI